MVVQLRSLWMVCPATTSILTRMTRPPHCLWTSLGSARKTRATGTRSRREDSSASRRSIYAILCYLSMLPSDAHALTLLTALSWDWCPGILTQVHLEAVLWEVDDPFWCLWFLEVRLQPRQARDSSLPWNALRPQVPQNGMCHDIAFDHLDNFSSVHVLRLNFSVPLLCAGWNCPIGCWGRDLGQMICPYQRNKWRASAPLYRSWFSDEAQIGECYAFDCPLLPFLIQYEL